MPSLPGASWGVVPLKGVTLDLTELFVLGATEPLSDRGSSTIPKLASALFTVDCTLGHEQVTIRNQGIKGRFCGNHASLWVRNKVFTSFKPFMD